MLSRVQLFATPLTVAHQAPLSMGFSRQEYWSGLPFPIPGDLPETGIEPGSPALLSDSLPSEPPGKPFIPSESESCSVVSHFLQPMDCIVHGILQARILEWVAFPFFRESLTQGSNPGLLHCRQILYQLSQQVGNLINKASLPDFNLISVRDHLRIRMMWLRELAAWKPPLPR